MKKISFLLIIIIFLGVGITIYAASVVGWGAGSIHSTRFRNELSKQCPTYYQSPSGVCLRQSFRTYYLHSYRGGGFGGGK